MKVVYVDMVIYGCVILILIGCSYGQTELRDCSKITCGDYELCREFDDETFSCVCSVVAERNDKTERCKPKYKWVEYKPEMWNDTRLVVFEWQKNYRFVIIRSIYCAYDLVPHQGEIDLVEKKIEPFLETKTYNDKYFEVLLIEPGHFKWIESSGGKIETNAVEGGYVGDEIVYPCRIFRNTLFFTGWMQPSNRSCHIRASGDSLYRKYNILIYVN